MFETLISSHYVCRIFSHFPFSTVNSSLLLSEPLDKDDMQMVSMLITPDDVSLLFDRCGDRSLSTRKQVLQIVSLKLIRTIFQLWANASVILLM